MENSAVTRAVTTIEDYRIQFQDIDRLFQRREYEKALQGLLKIAHSSTQDFFSLPTEISGECLFAIARIYSSHQYQYYSLAISYATRALVRNPSHTGALILLVHCKRILCQWGPEYSVLMDVLTKRLQTFSWNHVSVSVMLANMISFPCEIINAVRDIKAGLLLEETAKDSEKVKEERQRIAMAEGERTNERRIRVGYLSNDFRTHPLTVLISPVFRYQDRSKFEVFCYASNESDGSDWRQRIEKEAEHFICFPEEGIQGALNMALRIVSDKIDILVDLNGYKNHEDLPRVLAMKPAPIQVSYLAYLASCGGQWIDYLITDAVASPREHLQYYTEKLVYMPDCFFLNDHKERFPQLPELEDTKQSRSANGLPEDGFVFLCFNRFEKFDPTTFSCWCRILKRVPGSVLWVLKMNNYAVNNLKKEARRRDIEGERIVAGNMIQDRARHLERCQLGDLFLDTPQYNAHTTGVDILWAGVPMVTCPQRTMISRVGASLCKAALTGTSSAEYSGLMIARDMAEYEEKAVYLAENRQGKYEELRRMLKESRQSCPLFDAPRIVRNLDKAFLKMWVTNSRKV